MINPEFSSLLPVALGALPVVGAAIYKIRQEVNTIRVETKQEGSGRTSAITEVSTDKDGSPVTFVGIPTGALVHTRLGPNNLLVGIDYRARPGKSAKFQIALGQSRDNTRIIDSIEDHNIHTVPEVKGVEVRYLGEVHERVLKNHSLENLFE